MKYAQKTAYMCFVDLTKAFDRVRLADILKLLRSRNIAHENREMNTNNSTFIRAENQLTKKIPIHTGIRQEDSLSPTLFNLVMDEIIKEVKTAEREWDTKKLKYAGMLMTLCSYRKKRTT